MKITLLTVGKTGDKTIEQLIGRYLERLTHYVKFEVKVIPDIKGGKNQTTERQKAAEGESILAILRPSDHVVLLDERGKEHTSPGFADMIGEHLNRGTRDIVFVIGGPFGFSEAVYSRADAMMALSKMTLTHEMVRLFFVEQLYRAFTILKGESYHH